ncbi:MAG: nitroreductase family protein [Firmicutes bacterium]|nr:nitroreductase family protein [Bacillota bacterium]
MLDILLKRRSIRKYTGEAVPREKLEMILNAGLLSPTSRNRKPCEFIVVENRDTLKKLAKVRDHGSVMLEQAGAAIVVIADSELSSVWPEDCSIAMSNMHNMADSLGIGSCWIQGRERYAENGQSSAEFVRDLFGVPQRYELQAILSLGIPAEHPEPHKLEELDQSKVHWEKF